MESCIRFILCLAIFAQLTQFDGLVSGACVCNEKGTDYCEGCEESRVVRPKPKSYSDNYDLNMPPIGDNCWCSKLLIEPAAQPKPPCPKHKKTKCGCNNRVSSYSRYSDTVDYSHLNYADTDTTKSKSKDDTQPADPVSVSLAVQAGKAIQVPEAKLAYGFLQKPVDGLKKIYFSTVPEENLFKLNSDVITLKKRQQNTPKEEEEWLAIEEDDELDQGADDNDNEQPHLTYKQLGYVTEHFKNPKFRRVSSSSCRSSERSSYSGRKRLSDRVSVDCGFKPGRISTYRKIKTKSDSYNCY